MAKRDLISLSFLPELLRAFSPRDIQGMLQKGQEVLKQYFSLAGASTYIRDTLMRIDSSWKEGFSETSTLSSDVTSGNILGH
jgi:hypothetical protein